MPLVSFNENGEMVDNNTGKVVGKLENGKMVINSAGAESKSLEEMGVLQPEPPTEEQLEKFQGKKNKIIEEKKEQENKNESVESNDAPVSNVPISKVEQPPPVNTNSFRLNKSKYEVDQNSTFMIKFGLLYKEEGYFIPIKDESVSEFPNAQHHWVKFRMWNYSEQIAWKSKCNEYNNQAKMLVVNFNKLNEIKIKNLILDWSFRENNPDMKLLHCDGKLSDESYSIFKGLYPIIANIIVNLMNDVLENGV